jgi:predicted ATPase
VTERLSAIFPGWFRRFDFEAVAQRVSASVVHPRWTERFSPADWYDGFFVVLLHLTALASSEPGGVVAIDQPEDSLHPELVREVIGAMRDWSATHDVTVVLATHSPVVLDQFREDPDQVYVMEPGHERQPVELDTLKKRVWLEHYSLGDLYSHGEVGAPRNSA